MTFLVENGPALLFYVFGALAVAGAIGVVSLRNPMYGAISLLLTFLAVAALFLLRGAEFVGIVQIFVYGGGIMVLFLFVITMLNLVKGGPLEQHVGADPRLGSTWLAAAASVALFVFLARAALAFGERFPRWPARSEGFGEVAAVGRWIYRDYALHFEVVGLLILAGVIGAAVIARGLKKT